MAYPKYTILQNLSILFNVYLEPCTTSAEKFFFVKYVYLITSNVHVQIRIIFKQNTFALGNI